MPFWIRVIGEPHHNLFALRTNLRYGCVILRLLPQPARTATIFRALGRYNGSLGRPSIPTRCIAAWRGRWKYDGATS
jgi:soluble lytic murein transglycosylase-like protein